MKGETKIPRRVFLKGMGVAFLLSGCTSGLATLTAADPTATPLPTPTPTPLPSADGVAQAYLAAWSKGDYATMHSLLTQESQIRISPEQLESAYYQALAEATVTQIDTQLQSLLQRRF